jgi:hypothetical protein
MFAGDEFYSDDITSGVFEGELEQADFERELEDQEDQEGGR